jgi:3D-(3,5/4)-trihydroxycyclohexane-1,2-dione acylhydrolase (decyclizing)
MLPMEIATIVQEGLKVIFVLLQNHGFASIGGLSESHGSQRFGTRYRKGGGEAHNAEGELLPVDIAANAESWGIKVLRVNGIEEFKAAYQEAAAYDRSVMIHIETDLMGPNPPGTSWWDVPISETSRISSTQEAREWYEEKKQPQRHYLR